MVLFLSETVPKVKEFSYKKGGKKERKKECTMAFVKTTSAVENKNNYLKI